MTDQFEMPVVVEGKIYIYALTDPRTAEIRYVGKACDPIRRFNSHTWASVLGRYRDQRTSWLKNLKSAGLMPGIVILECVEDSEWEACEKKWIAHFRQHGARLTNTQDGGTGQSKGHRMTPEAIQKTASKLRGRKRAPEVVAKIAAAQRGVPKSKTSIEKLHAGVRKWWANLTPEQQAAKMAPMRVGAHERLGVQRTSTRNGRKPSGPRVGVIHDPKRRLPWRASIRIVPTRYVYQLGDYATVEEAVAAREMAEDHFYN